MVQGVCVCAHMWGGALAEEGSFPGWPQSILDSLSGAWFLSFVKEIWWLGVTVPAVGWTMWLLGLVWSPEQSTLKIILVSVRMTLVLAIPGFQS